MPSASVSTAAPVEDAGARPRARSAGCYGLSGSANTHMTPPPSEILVSVNRA